MFDVISSIFKPAADLVDAVHTSEEERLQLKSEMFKAQIGASGLLLDYEAKLNDAKASIIRAEAQGASWLQRNWRPITMLTFLILVVADTFGLTKFRLAAEAWTLLQLGLGGYVVGRSAEKIIPHVSQIMRKD